MRYESSLKVVVRNAEEDVEVTEGEIEDHRTRRAG
jgi:hypothetical protein